MIMIQKKLQVNKNNDCKNGTNANMNRTFRFVCRSIAVFSLRLNDFGMSCKNKYNLPTETKPKTIHSFMHKPTMRSFILSFFERIFFFLPKMLFGIIKWHLCWIRRLIRKTRLIIAQKKNTFEPQRIFVALHCIAYRKVCNIFMQKQDIK